MADTSPSFDQFEPGAGYEIENVRLLCWRCNNIKRNYAASDLEVVAAWMRAESNNLVADKGRRSHPERPRGTLAQIETATTDERSAIEDGKIERRGAESYPDDCAERQRAMGCE